MAIAPMIPPMMYRGDHYRLNFTTGLVLSILADNPDGLSRDDLWEIVRNENETTGIPGGPAGSQWAPPPKKPKKTFDDKAPRGKRAPSPDLVEDPEEEDERLPDTLKATCTYFLYRRDHLDALTTVMDYVGLVDQTSESILPTELGMGTRDMQVPMEDMEQDVASARGALTTSQEYLAGHPDDTTGGDHLVPYRVMPLSITEALSTVHGYVSNAGVKADRSRISPQMLATAALSGIQNPSVIRDHDTGDLVLDSTLPIRRNLQRMPSYRQFLWIVHSDPDTFVAAYASTGGGEDEAVELVLSKPKIAELENKGTKVALRVREARGILWSVKSTAQLILSGGPEGVWVGKPLQPRDVHSDIVSFESAGRGGFTHKTIGASSLLWETFDKAPITMHDYQLARERLTGRGDVGTYGEAVLGESGSIEGEQDAVNGLADDAESARTLSQAGRVVDRTSDEMMRAIGVPIVSKRPTASGIPLQESCTYVTKGRNGVTGNNARCRRPAIGGSGFCEIHGGTYLSPQETESLVRAAQQKIFATSSKAVEVIADLMINSTNDAVRLRAAEQILNRAGLSESRDININVDGEDEKESPAEVVRNKLQQLSRVSPKDQKEIETAQNRGDMSPYGEDEREVVEAEVIEDP